MKSSGPCLCGDPGCAHCGNPERMKLEEAIAELIPDVPVLEGRVFDECVDALANFVEKREAAAYEAGEKQRDAALEEIAQAASKCQGLYYEEVNGTEPMYGWAARRDMLIELIDRYIRPQDALKRRKG